MNVNLKKMLVLLTALIILIIPAGCGKEQDADPDHEAVESIDALRTNAEMVQEEAKERADRDRGEETAENNELNGEVDPSIMIIFNGNIVIEVNDVTKARQDIEDYLNRHGGYVSDSSFSYDDGVLQGKMTVRVPQEHFMQTMYYLEEKGNVQDRNITSTDVTSEYVDVESEIRSLEKQQERYLEMIDEADNVEEMLKVEERLQEVRSRIEKMVGRKRSLESAVNYSTITVHLQKDRDIYTVVFHGNTGHFEKSGDKIEVEVKEGYTLGAGDFPEVKKNNYDFVEWNTDKDGEGKKLTAELRIRENMEVYAIWEEINDATAVNVGALKDLGRDMKNAFIYGLNGMISLLAFLVVLLATVAPFAAAIAIIAYAVYRHRSSLRERLKKVSPEKKETGIEE